MGPAHSESPFVMGAGALWGHRRCSLACEGRGGLAVAVLTSEAAINLHTQVWATSVFLPGKCPAVGGCGSGQANT